MRLLIACVLVLLCPVLACAEPPKAALDGKILVLDASRSKPGTYAFIVQVSDDGTVTLRQVRQVVSVGDEIPDGDEPKPPTGLSAEVARWIREGVNYTGWESDSVRVAEAYEGVAERIKAGEFSDATAIALETAKLVDAALGQANAERWKTVRAKISAYLIGEFQAGRLGTTAAHEPVWREIATGARRAANAN